MLGPPCVSTRPSAAFCVNASLTLPINSEHRLGAGAPVTHAISPVVHRDCRAEPPIMGGGNRWRVPEWWDPRARWLRGTKTNVDSTLSGVSGDCKPILNIEV